MKVQDIMTHNVASVKPETTTYETAKLMEKYNVGCMPVCENENLLGIVTDRDIVLRTVAEGEDVTKFPVKNIMTKDVYTVSPETSVEEATKIMSTKQVRMKN